MLRRRSLQYSASQRSQIADGLDMSVKAGAAWPAHILNARIVRDRRSSCSHVRASHVTTVAAAGVKIRRGRSARSHVRDTKPPGETGNAELRR
jgi:hypothetical protein